MTDMSRHASHRSEQTDFALEFEWSVGPRTAAWNALWRRIFDAISHSRPPDQNPAVRRPHEERSQAS